MRINQIATRYAVWAVDMLCWRHPDNVNRFQTLGILHLLEEVIASPQGTLDDQCRLRAVFALKHFCFSDPASAQELEPPETPQIRSNKLKDLEDEKEGIY
jgi:hypothetical protein